MERQCIFYSEDAGSIRHIPTIYPNWNHSPRSSAKAFVLYSSTPDLFAIHANETLKVIKNKPQEHRIAVIKSWNECGESNYIEPDARFGTGYLEVLKKSLSCDPQSL